MTVDEELLEHARSLRSDLNDAGLLDEALSALVGQHRAAEIDGGYARLRRTSPR
jgi:post-segregation antitoxin (ccd killing protein)